MERRIRYYPVLEGKIVEYGYSKQAIADALGVTQRTLTNKINGLTEFTWDEVVKMQREFFPGIVKDDLMKREPEEDSAAM